jgi:putative spermidine/putrescine transport system permease protein
VGTVQEVGALATPRRRIPYPAVRGWPLAWLGVVPFFLYAILFLLLPVLWLVVGAFQNDANHFTLAQVQTLFEPQYRSAFVTSIKLSIVTALGGGLFGFFVAYAAIGEQMPRWIRPVLTTFSGVAANFAGIPLAFAFVATLGTTGVVTDLLAGLGLNIYNHGFSLFTFSGLTLTYIYFQLPLMILVIMPALDGIRREWREAATNLGATPFQFWRYVGLPILWPSLLGAMVLLFGNAFSAYATPYALTSGYINLVPILIGSVLSGNILVDPHFGDALAFGMIVIIAISLGIYALLQRRVERWMR